MSDPRPGEAIALMQAFAVRTGLASTHPVRRYLWTDAFAVCNDLGLARHTGEAAYTDRALALVGQVHHTLGRHRPDDRRRGWLSGLDDADGESHPTRGGLRIGKPQPERRANAPFDERLEWERDGQYFHYLTRWMHALDQVARTTRAARYNTWARELADTAYNAFTYRTAAREPRRMVWKMSIDLARVLVPAMGQHDPLDGYVTALQLGMTAAALPEADATPALATITAGYAAMLQHCTLTTLDPLGLGGLLTDAWRVQQLVQQGAAAEAGLAEQLLRAAQTGLRHYVRCGETAQPADHRLAFRELGLAIGLHAVERLHDASLQSAARTAYPPRLRALIESLMAYLPLCGTIEDFWRDPASRRAESWLAHEDINTAMLATSLVPDGYLDLVAL